MMQTTIDQNDVGTLSGALRMLSKSLMVQPISLREFIPEAWKVIEPAKTLIHNWHIDLICEYLEAVDLGQIRRLMFNVPPRMTKSNIVSVIWPTWSWIEKPWLRWLFASYSSSLSTKFSVDRRTIIESDWYKNNWGLVYNLSSDQNVKTEFTNNERGSMFSTSVGGAATGKGGDRIVIDDIVNPEQAESKAAREAANIFYARTLSTRLDDEHTGAIVGVMQRLHKEDLTGLIMKEKGWTIISIPSCAEEKERIVFPISGYEKIREKDEMLCPERFTREHHDKKKMVLGKRGSAAQLQQKPEDERGNIFLRSDWQYYREMPIPIRSIWSWDTAVKTKERNDLTAGIRIVECANGFYIDDLVKRRMEYPEMKATIKNKQGSKPADVILIEDASSGQIVLQDLRRNSNLPVIPFEADKDKILRAHLVSPTLEAHKIYVPENSLWVSDFIDNCSNFPDVDHDDDVDSLTAAILYLTGRAKNGIPSLWINE